MDVSSVNLFLALLAFAGWAGALVVGATLVPVGALRRLRADIADVALWLAFGVAATCLAGSLYYSEIAGFTPCPLCWYQRICMYPLVPLLGIAALRSDRGIGVYALPLSVVGGAISAYHYQLQLFPEQGSGVCSLEAPCTAREVNQFGFVTIPLMAFTGFLVITVLLLSSRSTHQRRSARSEAADPSAAGVTGSPAAAGAPAPSPPRQEITAP